MECPHVGRVRLLDAYNTQFLHHSGTGELVRLESRCYLRFDAQGAGYLEAIQAEGSPSPPEVTWLSKAKGGPLRWSLHERACDGRRFLADCDSATSCWVDTMCDQHTSSARLHNCLDVASQCALAAWRYALPLCGTQLYWELAYLQNGLLGDCSRTNWCKDGWKRWCENLKTMGFEEGHLRRGHKGLRALAKRSQSGVDVGDLTASTTEPLCSTVALLDIAARSAQSHHLRCDDDKQRATRFVWASIDSLLGNCSTTLRIADGSVFLIDLNLHRGFVDFEDASELLGNTSRNPTACAALAAAKRLMRSIAGANLEQVHLSTLMIKLVGRETVRASRSRPANSPYALLIQAVADHVEVSHVIGSSWEGMRCVELPTLFCKMRAKRVSPALKEELYKAAQASKDVKDVKAIIAGKRIYGKTSEKSLVPKSTLNWDWDTAFQNLCSARRAFSSQPKSICVAGDDGNVTEKTAFMLVMSQPAKFVAWAPIQAG